jgi:tetratricopeptide (TPR) repeat protein
VAAAFGVHPLHVESVAWAAERKDVLSTLFWCLTVGAYVAYVKNPRPIRYLVLMATFACGLMSKPMLVTVPVVLLLLDVWPLRRVTGTLTPAGRGRAPSPTWGSLILEKLPLAGLSLVSAVVTFLVQRHGGAVAEIDALPWDARVQNALVSCVAYLGKAFWPVNLSILYPFPHAIPLASTVGAAVTLVGLSALALRATSRYPYVLVGWFGYLVTLVPVIGLVQVGNQAMADRYTYVPMVGIFVVVAWGIADVMPDFSARRVVLPTLAILVIGALAATARVQTGYWADAKTIWQHAVDAASDNYPALGALGALLDQEGKADEALALYRQAVKANPGFAAGHFNLGGELVRRGKLDEATVEFSEALRLKPEYSEAHYELGAVLFSMGRVDNAVKEYELALALAPDMVDAQIGLSLALAKQGDAPKALRQLAEVARLHPTLAQPHYWRARILSGQADKSESVSEYREAIRLDPNLSEPHNELGLILFGQHDSRAALLEYSEALRLQPQNPEVRNNRGLALATLGRIPEATADFAEAVRLRPQDETSRFNLGLALRELGKTREAVQEFEALLRINPKHEGARRELTAIAAKGRD